MQSGENTETKNMKEEKPEGKKAEAPEKSVHLSEGEQMLEKLLTRFTFASEELRMKKEKNKHLNGIPGKSNDIVYGCQTAPKEKE